MKLGVNIDHAATLRQARKTFEPDPVRAAIVCEEAGADSIVLHLREDRRHIQERDLDLIKEMVNVRINLEMAAEDEMVEKALATLPSQATLVPEKRQELTTEGGLDVKSALKKIKNTVETLKKAGISASLFIDPDREQIKAAEDAGADSVEFHTGTFAEAFIHNAHEEHLEKLKLAVSEARKSTNLAVHAGHGLTYLNTGIIAAIPGIEELNIGHSIISRAVFSGLHGAVREMIRIIERAGGTSS